MWQLAARMDCFVVLLKVDDERWKIESLEAVSIADDYVWIVIDVM